MRTIDDVLNEMIGANYMLTQDQIREIRDIHDSERRTVKEDIRAAFEAGRKHDALEIRNLLLKYTDA